MATYQRHGLQDTSMWTEVYAGLLPFVKKHVHHVGLQTHIGQESDVIQDVIQETVVRIFIQMKKAERGEVPPVHLPLYFAKKVAHNHLLDIVRKESRLVRPSCDATIQEMMMRENTVDSIDDVIDDIDKEPLFVIIAHVIAGLPEKRRRALLIDLAMHTAFDESPSLLQRALAKEQINLEMYGNLLPVNQTEKEKQRHSSLLTQAYKTVKEDVQAYLAS